MQQKQQQQQCLQQSALIKKKEASPWWDFLSHCKEAADSSDSEHDDTTSYANYNDIICTTGCTTSAKNSADDDLAIKESAPLSPASAVPATPVKLISTGSNNNGDGENDVGTAGPETPGTQDSSFSSFDTSSSSSSIVDDDDIRGFSSFQPIEMDEGKIKEGEEECNFNGEITPGSVISSSQATTSASVVLSPPPKVATQYINDQQSLQLLQSISKEKQSSSGDDDNFNTSPAIVFSTDDATDEDLEASFEVNVVDENDVATTATVSSPDDAPMSCDQFPSVFHHRQQPVSALQDHLLSCIKLPLRAVSILFSVWVAIILVRIVLIFSLIVVDHNPLLEYDGFNSPGIY